MLLAILLTALVLICLAMIGVVLLQRSEGGALGMGGGTTGFMSARGAGDLLTRSTWILGGLFIVLCMTITLVSGRASSGGSVTDRLDVEAIDPSELAVPPPVAPSQPAEGLAAPAADEGLDAPAPTLRNPFLAGEGEAAPAAPAP